MNADSAGQSLLDYYAQHYRHSTREEWAERIHAGQIFVNGVVATAEMLLQPGQWLAYHRPPWEEEEVPLHFDVLYEDEDLLVIAKPSGLPVMPGGGFLEHTLLWQLQQRYPDAPPIPVHRLGRGTSGLMLLARSPLARRYLARQMRESTLKTDQSSGLRKTYRALIGASALDNHTILTYPIGKVPHSILGYVYAASPEGKPAHSEVQIVRRASDQTLVEVTIRTGRPHQIRIHLAAAGYPLVGDPLYGVGGVPYDSGHSFGNGKAERSPFPGDCGYYLHAYRLTVPHPRTGNVLHFCAPPPDVLS
ncbi:RluA family pseudouridine synthase [Leptolyngbya sp. PL-A3]